jgi:DNA replication protein DnaD
VGTPQYQRKLLNSCPSFPNRKDTMKGWISLHRKIINNPIFTERRTFSKFEAWIWLLLRANHSEGKVLIGNHMIQVKRGSFVTSQHQLCKQFNWGTTKLRAYLKLMESEQMIEVSALRKATCITICNYESYQNLQTDNKSDSNHKQTTDKLQSKPNNNVKQKETIQQRETNFVTLVKDIALKEQNEELTDEMIKNFTSYWTESNVNGQKMRYEMQKTFDIKRRLNKWLSNTKEWNIIKETKYSYEDFRFDATGYNKMAYCGKCNKSDFYKKPHIEDSRCCADLLHPNKI